MQALVDLNAKMAGDLVLDGVVFMAIGVNPPCYIYTQSTSAQV